jgi:hypothetical protein
MEEAFLGVKQEIRHLRIFSCPLYIHVHVEKNTKLEPLGLKFIFVRYNETSKAYMIYILAWRKKVVSRDVKL